MGLPAKAIWLLTFIWTFLINIAIAQTPTSASDPAAASASILAALPACAVYPLSSAQKSVILTTEKAAMHPRRSRRQRLLPPQHDLHLHGRGVQLCNWAVRAE